MYINYHTNQLNIYPTKSKLFFKNRKCDQEQQRRMINKTRDLRMRIPVIVEGIDICYSLISTEYSTEAPQVNNTCNKSACKPHTVSAKPSSMALNPC